MRNMIFPLVVAAAASLPSLAYDSPAPTVEVSDITRRDAYVKITPPDPEIPYFYRVLTKEKWIRFGEEEGIYWGSDMKWWTDNQALYNLPTWEEVAEMMASHGTKEGLVSYLDDIPYPLNWGTEYVAYAYTVDPETWAQNSDVTWVEFTTEDTYTVDMTFDMQLVSVEEDPESEEGFNKARIKVTPSDPNYPWGIHCHETRFYDQFTDHPEWPITDYLTRQLWKYIFSSAPGERTVTFINIQPDKEYYAVACGWDQAPICGQEFTLLKFTGDLYNAGVTAADASDVYVVGGRGTLTVRGLGNARVYATDGRLAGCLRDGGTLPLNPGVYIVTSPDSARIWKAAVK